MSRSCVVAGGFVLLTLSESASFSDGGQALINPEEVSAIEYYRGGSLIVMAHTSYEVSEDPEIVAIPIMHAISNRRLTSRA